MRPTKEIGVVANSLLRRVLAGDWSGLAGSDEQGLVIHLPASPAIVDRAGLAAGFANALRTPGGLRIAAIRKPDPS